MPTTPNQHQLDHCSGILCLWQSHALVLDWALLTAGVAPASCMATMTTTNIPPTQHGAATTTKQYQPCLNTTNESLWLVGGFFSLTQWQPQPQQPPLSLRPPTCLHDMLVYFPPLPNDVPYLTQPRHWPLWPLVFKSPVRSGFFLFWSKPQPGPLKTGPYRFLSVLQPVLTGSVSTGH